MPFWYVETIAFLIGLCIGSFLNVCIYRFLRGESIVRPPSHCPSCKKSIAWHDNIPLFSFLMLRGRCRFCGVRISFRYFTVELLSGVVFLGCVRLYGLTGQAAAGIVMLVLLLGISAADFEERIIPDEMSLSGIVFGLIFSFCFPHLQQETNHFRGLMMSAIGVLAGGGLIYATGILGELVFRKESMGGGDVKLMGMMGAFLGWKAVCLVFFLSPIFALPLGLYMKFVKKEDYIPYGPFLSMGGVAVLFFGHELLRLFLFSY